MVLRAVSNFLRFGVLVCEGAGLWIVARGGICRGIEMLGKSEAV